MKLSITCLSTLLLTVNAMQRTDKVYYKFKLRSIKTVLIRCDLLYGM